MSPLSQSVDVIVITSVSYSIVRNYLISSLYRPYRPADSSVCACVRSELSRSRFDPGRGRRSTGRLQLQVCRVVDAWRGRGKMFRILLILPAAGPATPAYLWDSFSSWCGLGVNAAVVRLHAGTGASLSASQSYVAITPINKQSGRFGVR